MKKLILGILFFGLCNAGWYGSSVPNNVTSNTVTLTTANVVYTALSARTNRRVATITNDSDTIVYINEKNSLATANYGIRLNANGGSYTIDEANPSFEAWYVFCPTTANKNIKIIDAWRTN